MARAGARTELLGRQDECQLLEGILTQVMAGQSGVLVLRTVSGMRAGAASDRFLVGLATLSLLAAAVADEPLLCMVDDSQWLDRVSAQTLEFVARRLLAEPVLLVLALNRRFQRPARPATVTVDGADVHVPGRRRWCLQRVDQGAAQHGRLGRGDNTAAVARLAGVEPATYAGDEGIRRLADVRDGERVGEPGVHRRGLPGHGLAEREAMPAAHVTSQSRSADWAGDA